MIEKKTQQMADCTDRDTDLCLAAYFAGEGMLREFGFISKMTSAGNPGCVGGAGGD